jgi:hypothetical protein
MEPSVCDQEIKRVVDAFIADLDMQYQHGLSDRRRAAHKEIFSGRILLSRFMRKCKAVKGPKYRLSERVPKKKESLQQTMILHVFRAYEYFICN